METKDKDLKKATRKGLRTMRKSHAKHPLREEGRIIGEIDVNKDD